MGFRLPLDSLPWATPETSDADRRGRSLRPSRSAAAAPARGPARSARGHSGAARPAAQAAQRRGPAAGARRVGARRRSHRALRRAAGWPAPCLHAAGRAIEDYLELVAAIEGTAAQLGDAGHPRGLRRRAHDPRLNHLKVTPDPGVIEVNIHPAQSWDGAGRADHHALRGGAPDAARHREVHARRPAHRHRRRQPRGPRRADAGRQPVPAPARSAAQPRRLLAQSPVALVPVLGALRRPDEPGAARRRRRATTRSTSSRSPSRRCRRAATRRRRGSSTASSATCSSTSPATRTAPSSASTSSTRPRRQRPAGAGRAARVRDAAARADEPGAAAAPARARRAFWKSPTSSRWCAGARSSTTASCCRTSWPRTSTTCSTISAGSGYAIEPDWFAPHFEFRFPARSGHAARRALELRQALEPWHVLGEEPGAGGAVALRRLLGRAPAGQGHGHDRLAARPRLQRPLGSAAPDRHGRRVRRRRPLSRVAAAELPASDDPACTRRSCSTWSTRGTTLARRLHLPRRAPRRAELRDVSGQRLRGGGPPARAFRDSATRRGA